jgi:hypothetical protein
MKREHPMNMNTELKPITLRVDHPLIAMHLSCYCCDRPFDEKEPICLFPLGPGDDKEARENAVAGQPYNAVSIPLHYACVTGITFPL